MIVLVVIFVLVKVPCAWPNWSFHIFCLNKYVDLFQFCAKVLQHPHCVQACPHSVWQAVFLLSPDRFSSVFFAKCKEMKCLLENVKNM